MNFTAREQEVADLLKKGMNPIEIAQELGVTKSWIKNNLTNIYRKLGVKNNVNAILVLLGQEPHNPIKGKSQETVLIPGSITVEPSSGLK